MLASRLARHRHHLSRRPPRAMALANVQPLAFRDMAPMLEQIQRLQQLVGDWPFATTLDTLEPWSEWGTPELNTLSRLRDSDSRYQMLFAVPGIKPEDIRCGARHSYSTQPTARRSRGTQPRAESLLRG